MLNADREPVHKFLMETLKKNGLNMLSECPVKQVNDWKVDVRRTRAYFAASQLKIQICFAIAGKLFTERFYYRGHGFAIVYTTRRL